MLIVKLAPVWACFLLCFLLARVAAARKYILPDWRLSWVFAFLLTGAFTVCAAEIASAFDSLDRRFLAIAWVTLDVALGVLIWRKFRRETIAWAQEARGCGAKFLACDRATRWLYGIGLAFALFLGIVSLRAPQFVWDCKSYHVPRMLYWMQDKNLRHFPTSDIRRVAYDPGAEIAATTLYLLDGSDRPINLISWFSVLTAAILASFATELLMGSVDEQAGREWLRKKAALAGGLAFVLVLTIPEGLFQAISTENDFVAAAWNLALACMTVLFLRQKDNWFYAGGIGLSLALGICTKATTFISAAPFLIGAFAVLGWRRCLRPALALAGVLVALVTLVNAPWFLRNDATFGHFLGPVSISKINVNPSFTPDRCVANIFRNLSIYTATPSAAVTQALNKALSALIAATGRQSEDPSALVPYRDGQFVLHFEMPGRAVVGNGDGVGNIHAWLILCALLILWRLPLRNALGFYALCAVAGFCLSCSYLRWHPWLYRLHITYFVLAMPVVAAALAAVAPRFVMVVLGLVCVVSAISILVFNSQCPIYEPNPNYRNWSREEHLFGSNIALRRPYIALTEDIIQRGCTNVLLKSEAYNFDYGLWVCLWNRGYHGTIQECMVDNETDSLRRWQFDSRTAMVFLGTQPPPGWQEGAQPLLQVSYNSHGTLNALFPSPFSDHWWRLLGPENSATLLLTLSNAQGIGPDKPADIQFSCQALDHDGHALSNNVLRLTSANGTGDFDLDAGTVDAGTTITNPVLEVQAMLLKPLAREKYPAYLAKLQLSWKWAAKPSPADSAKPSRPPLSQAPIHAR